MLSLLSFALLKAAFFTYASKTRRSFISITLYITLLMHANTENSTWWFPKTYEFKPCERSSHCTRWGMPVIGVLIAFMAGSLAIMGAPKLWFFFSLLYALLWYGSLALCSSPPFFPPPPRPVSLRLCRSL